MAAGHTLPVDFWIEPENITNPVERKVLLQELLAILKPFFGSFEEVHDGNLHGGHYYCIYTSECSSLFVKMYQQGLVTVTLDYMVNEDAIHKPVIIIDDGHQIEQEIRTKFKSKREKVLPPLKRCPPLNVYFTSSDDRLLEYDIDQLIFEERSNFQKVQIYHSNSFGNILVLDDLQNLAESDFSYTKALMNYGKEDYKGKEILILGGGDGALLWELLKEDPGFVTMIDIDEVVIKACSKYMRSVCGNCLDNYEGKNYKIIIDDAVIYMKRYLEEGRKFDYVFYDLTDVPLSENPQEQLWDFIRSIINLGVGLLTPSGRYLTHCIGIQCKSALKMFEEQLRTLEKSVTFTRTTAQIPSFMENWCFYQLSVKSY